MLLLISSDNELYNYIIPTTIDKIFIGFWNRKKPK